MKRIATVLLIGFLSPLAFSAQAETVFVFNTPNVMPQLRADIGRPIVDVAIDLTNGTSFNPEKIAPEGASFFYDGEKTVGQNVDDLRITHPLIIAITTCPNATTLQAKVETISVWENIEPAKQTQVALGIQQTLESMNNPPAVQTPSALRAAQGTGFGGVVFNYTKGDTKEEFGILNEDVGQKETVLKLRWSVTNTAVCPNS